MQSLKKNFVYQTAYQILAAALPLITTPYVSRILGADNLGIYSYTKSIVTYFVLFAMLGVNNYGSRRIALSKKDRQSLSTTFFEIYTMQFFLSICASVVYFSFLNIMNVNYKLISIIHMISIFGVMTDINWLFFGLEKINITVTRNCFVKIITLILIFTCVKTNGDLWKYTTIMALSTVLSDIILVFNARKYIQFTPVKLSNVVKHLKPNLLLYVPIFALSIYHYMDKTMLGFLSTPTQSGYYYNVDKIVLIPLGIITGLGTVMLPRFTVLAKENNLKGTITLFSKSVELVVFLSMAIVFGICAIAQEFTPWFFGEEFQPCVDLLQVLCIVVIFKAISQIICSQYLIPRNKNKVYIIATFAGAGTNLIFNLMFIPKMGAMGAVVATILSEITACFIEVINIYKEIPIVKMIFYNWFYVLDGAVMFFTVRKIANLICTWQSAALRVGVEFCIGVVSYISLALVYWLFTKQGVFYDTLYRITKRITKSAKI